MAKVDPLQLSKQEQTIVDEKIAKFVWDEVKPVHQTSFLIAGREGTGKTHLALSISNEMPTFIADSEYRAAHVIKKYQGGKYPIYPKIVRRFSDYIAFVQYIKANYKPPGAIIFDSATDLQESAEKAYLQRTKLEKIYPAFLWTEVWAMCDAIIDDIIFSGFTFIATCRVKEEYQANQSTGKWIPRVYNKLPYKVDVGIQMTSPKEPAFLFKNGFSNDLSVPIPRNLSLAQITELLQC